MQQWPDIIEPYRSEAWSECARLARAHVDEDPFDLSTRALLASVLLRSRQRALALMQYERLLPLAVGQGELFRALGTQRRLDELLPAAARHPDRYRAIQDWFRALTGPAAGAAVEADGDAGPLGALLGLPPDAFSVVAEQSKVVPLDLAPQTLDDAAGVLWVVYFGRIRWTVAGPSPGGRETHSAEAGDVLHLPPGEPAARWIELEPETPCEVIRFDPGLATLLGHARGGRAAAPAARPRPDPTAEPLLAVGVPRDRRRETRMAVMLENRVALLGEAGTRVAPLHGTVVDVSTTGIGLQFPAAQIRGARGIRPQALVTLQVGLRDAGEALPVTGRIAWIEWHPVAPGQGTEHARIGLEFVAMSAEQRTRLVHLLDSAARSQT